jgi:release factor glutamine methyltransferase
LTLIEVLRRAAGYLEQRGSDSPRLDSELLLAHALGVRRLDLYLQFERPLSDTELAPYRELIARRGKGEPVAYLVGRKEFMGLEFEVTRDVLVPNPDTELLVQVAVSWGRERRGRLCFADIGTGSGCIAVALAHFLREAEVFASDLSSAALAVAARNAARHGVGSRVHLAQGELLQPLPRAVDAICANLPYLDENAALSAEVLAQPKEALFPPTKSGDFAGTPGGGGDRLVRRLLEEAPSHLTPDGLVFAEVDPAIATGMLELARGLYARAVLHKDLGGHDRVLQAWKS